MSRRRHMRVRAKRAACRQGVVLICTPSHKDAVEAQLFAANCDVAKARSTGQYVMLDAEETLARFMRDGQPDKQLFTQVIGGLIDEVSARCSHVKAFGEMVALLQRSREAGFVHHLVKPIEPAGLKSS